LGILDLPSKIDIIVSSQHRERWSSCT